MDVQLYVYDLSRGLARQMSRQFLGIQIDAVYHTSLVFGNIEYFFGAGVQTCRPGGTHHGQPMEKLHLGKTELSVDVILEYLETLKQVYTAESYDLFTHNCNNFTNDFATFLIGTGIPSHITSLPEMVMNTPFGMMLRPQLDRAMRPLVQAPVTTVRPQAPLSIPPPKPKPHSHLQLSLPMFLRQSTEPITYTKVPPLDKLVEKMDLALINGSLDPAIKSTVDFIANRSSNGAREATLPDLKIIASTMLRLRELIRPDLQFTFIDLFRLLLVDPRVSGWFAKEEHLRTIKELIQPNFDADYKLRLVTLHAACNLFTSPLFRDFALPSNKDLTASLIELSSIEMADRGKTNIRVAAASLALNLATAAQQSKAETNEVLSEDLRVQLAASLNDTLSHEETSPEAIKIMVVALARLAYCAPVNGEVLDACEAMESANVIRGRIRFVQGAEDKNLLQEISGELFGKGLEVGLVAA